MSEISVAHHFIFALIATFGWTVFFNAPKEELIQCSITGASGWAIYVLLDRCTANPVFSNFTASFLVTLLSEVFARKFKKPAILYIIPGIIPLVPGLGIYNTMLNMIQGSYIEAIAIGTNVALVAGAIVIGMLVTTSLFRAIAKSKISKSK